MVIIKMNSFVINAKVDAAHASQLMYVIHVKLIIIWMISNVTRHARIL